MMLTLREGFGQTMKARKVSAATQANYLRKLKRYAGPLLDLPLDQLTRHLLEDQIFNVVARIQKEGSRKAKDGYGTAQLVLATISVIYRTVGEDLGLPSDPGKWPGAGLQNRLRKARDAHRQVGQEEAVNG